MNKGTVLALCALASLAVNAAPVFYGKINFEARYIDQDASSKRSEVIAAATKNLPPRLGMFGTIKPDELDATVTYFGEMGYHTWANSGLGEVKVRLAGASLDFEKFGKITIGRHYSPTELIGAEIDPLMNTGASGVGLDQYFDIQGARTFNGIGYYSRYFQDTMSYKTPLFKGLQLALAVDNNSRQENSKIKILSTDSETAYSATYYSALLTYDFEFSGLKNKFFASYVKGNGLAYSFAHSSNIDQDERMQIAFKTNYNLWNFAAHYGKEDVTKSTDHNVEPSNKLMFLTAFYNSERHLLGVTYSRASYDDDNGSDDVVQTQYALGYQYHLTKGAELTATLAQFDTDTDNKAKSLILGTALNF